MALGCLSAAGAVRRGDRLAFIVEAEVRELDLFWQTDLESGCGAAGHAEDSSSWRVVEVAVVVGVQEGVGVRRGRLHVGGG